MSPNDDTLWERIKQTIIPINRDDVLPSVSTPMSRKKANKPKERFPQRKKIVPPISHDKKKTESFSAINRQTQRKIDKGQIKTDGKLDLHGLTVAQAHQTFIQYIKQAVSQNKKTIIVVTGKGSKERGTGVIRRELPYWIEDPKIACHIHGFSEPIRNQGRYLIILRRQKTKR